MRKLTYFINRGNDDFEAFLEYSIPSVGEDELYARQLCTYFIIKGRQFELLSNEMKEDEEILVLNELRQNESFPDEAVYHGRGLNIEFRYFLQEEKYRLIEVLRCDTHFQIIRYLLKDVVDIPGAGQFFTTSTEIDEDRGVYVVYVKDLNDDRTD